MDTNYRLERAAVVADISATHPCEPAFQDMLNSVIPTHKKTWDEGDPLKLSILRFRGRTILPVDDVCTYTASCPCHSPLLLLVSAMRSRLRLLLSQATPQRTPSSRRPLSKPLGVDSCDARSTRTRTSLFFVLAAARSSAGSWSLRQAAYDMQRLSASA